jgi:hypothetical protein
MERVLEYMCLSMSKDQGVNVGIAGGTKRALIPFHALNAKHWYDRSYPRRRVRELLRKIEEHKEGILAS